jgi:hypothetical protein
MPKEMEMDVVEYLKRYEKSVVSSVDGEDFREALTLKDYFESDLKISSEISDDYLLVYPEDARWGAAGKIMGSIKFRVSNEFLNEDGTVVRDVVHAYLVGRPTGVHAQKKIGGGDLYRVVEWRLHGDTPDPTNGKSVINDEILLELTSTNPGTLNSNPRIRWRW